MTVEARLSAIEERLEASERAVRQPAKGKDAWDILTAIGSLLIPVAIFWVGQNYTTEMAAAEIKSEEARAQNSLAVTIAGAKVSQASLVLGALEPLAGEDGPKKRLAIQAVLLALPQDGPRLVGVLSRTDPNPEIRNYALSSLAERKGTLIERLFAPQPQLRGDAASELLQGWKGDPNLPPLLAASARQAFKDPAFPGRGNGIYNILVVLSHMDKPALAPHRDDLRRLADEMRPMGGKTSGRSDKLVERLK